MTQEMNEKLAKIPSDLEIEQLDSSLPKGKAHEADGVTARCFYSVGLSWVENISGALLNMSKSVVIPLTLPENLDWLIDNGCIIAKDREPITYLSTIEKVKISRRKSGRHSSTN
ncbi:hypothetical protein R1sor_012388 [Riccia sorocarpa]|uniref:Uncharacterized protein n=1 Tax=Riccia sorocarpa TaxID=122646 RepID=A0ABD3I3M7_9MARC